jgi:hypothetical protein
MGSRRTSRGTPHAGADTTVPLLLGVELVRADVAKAVLGLELGDAPCGGPITWALFIDAAPAGRTDEPMTDDAAQAWARRILGEGVRFQPAHRDGGYWLADTAEVLKPSDREGGWSR